MTKEDLCRLIMDINFGADCGDIASDFEVDVSNCDDEVAKICEEVSVEDMLSYLGDLMDDLEADNPDEFYYYENAVDNAFKSFRR